MPQIVCSHHAADPCSVVIGDRALLSAAEGVCVYVCARKMCISFNCVLPCFLARVRLFACVKGSINSDIRQRYCLPHCLSVFVQFAFIGQIPLYKVQHGKHSLDK